MTLGCEMNLQYYPFDSQICPVEAESCEFSVRISTCVTILRGHNYLIIQLFPYEAANHPTQRKNDCAIKFSSLYFV